jgi:hypothetical protein
MTALTDIKAVTPTANAKAVVSAKGADVSALMAAALLKAAELKVLVAQIIALHPAGDANLTALNSILAELA